MTKVTALDLIREHNEIVLAIREVGDLKIPSTYLFRFMKISHALACEGATIVHEARELGLDVKIDMQSGEISAHDKETREYFATWQIGAEK